MTIANTLQSGRTRFRKAFVYVPAYLVCLVTTGVGMLLMTLLVTPLATLWPENMKGKRVRASIHYFFKACIGFYRALGLLKGDLSALDSIATKGPVLIVANHPSLMDAQLMVSRLPNAVCIMKSALNWSPFLGIGARLAGYIPNNSAHGLVRLAVQRLREGSQLIIFPEGTRNRGRSMVDMKGAFATIARRADVPVQLVVIDIDSQYLCKGWPLWKIPALPVTFNIRLSQTLEPTMTRDEMFEAVEQVYKTELSNPSNIGYHLHTDSN